MVEFKCPPMSLNPVVWGPPSTAAELEGQDILQGYLDYVDHLDKFPLSRVGKICDFTISGQRFLEQRGKGMKGKAGGKGKAQQPIAPAAKDDEGFSLVDTRTGPGKSSGKGRSTTNNRTKGRGKGLNVNYQEGILGQKQKSNYFNNNQNSSKGKGKGKGGPRRNVPSFKEWSVETKTEWELKQEIMLHSLSKLQVDHRLVEFKDLLWAGKLHNFNRVFDRVTTKTSMPVKRFQDLQFFSVTTSDDPHLQQFLTEDEEASVIATDDALAVLVAAARSMYSWDLVITKLQGKLIIDTRYGSQVNGLSVNETAQEPPSNEDKESINSPLKLSQEASCINQNFSQMVLDHQRPAKEMPEPNPFEEEDEEGSSAASGAYRYRKITIPGRPKADDPREAAPVTIIVRTEVNCRVPDAPENKGYCSVKALNEYEPKPNYSWRNSLEAQRGACLATEVKNNSFKLGRWTAQAILAGCDTLKLGYVTRTNPSDNSSHLVLGVQTHMTDGFADQIGLTRNNMYGILRSIIDLVQGWDDGKYLILKDPTKSVLRIYEVPWDSFDSEEEEEEEEEEDQELDEDGNVAPTQN